MLILLLFAFISGLLTILAPCIWPLLPIVLSSSTTGGHRKPFGITLGVVFSFSFFTLSVSYLVMIFHFDPNILRLLASVAIAFLGLTLIIPGLLLKYDYLIAKLATTIGGKPIATHHGFLGGFITGISLGLIWSPCAGPILATIAALAATQAVNFQIILVTLAFALGVGIPLFLFSLFGSWLFNRSKFVSKYTLHIQKLFGMVMILTALAIYTNYDKVLQVKLLDAFPSYSTFLYHLESNETVQKQLDIIQGKKEEMKQELQTQGLLSYLGNAPEFVGITQWLNLPADRQVLENPLKMQELRGKVVLIDFWTYTCINCIRTLPYVKKWHEKYKDAGLVVIGVHTPEFEFEKNTQNVKNAIAQFGIAYPVAQDNDYATWNAYNNRFWPAKYLIDHEGKIRYSHFGEGEYEETERAIQELLKTAGQIVPSSIIDLPQETATVSQTPETYLGLARIDRFASPQRLGTGVQHGKFTFPQSIPQHYIAFNGSWDLQEEYALPSKGARLRFHFLANKVFLVITPQTLHERIKVYLDGKEIENAYAGEDVKNSYVILERPRLYHILDLENKFGDHFLELEFETGNVFLYAFTFG